MNLKKGKTEVMLFGTSKRLCKARTLNISIKDRIINFAKPYKYLGVNLDPTLLLNDDFNKKYKKNKCN